MRWSEASLRLGQRQNPYRSAEFGPRHKNRGVLPVLSPGRGCRLRNPHCHQMDDFRAGGPRVRVRPATVAAYRGLADIHPVEPAVDTAPPAFPPDSLSLRGAAGSPLIAGFMVAGLSQSEVAATLVASGSLPWIALLAVKWRQNRTRASTPS